MVGLGKCTISWRDTYNDGRSINYNSKSNHINDAGLHRLRQYFSVNDIDGSIARIVFSMFPELQQSATTAFPAIILWLSLLRAAETIAVTEQSVLTKG